MTSSLTALWTLLRSLARFWSRLALIGIILSLTIGLSAVPATAAAPETPLLTVSGEGSVQVETALAIVRLGVVVRGKTAGEVQQQVAQSSNKLITKLKQLNVEKLQTTGISLNPQYDYSNGQAKPIGVIGQNSVQFEVPIDKAGSLLDQSVAAGATQIESVSFRATEPVLVAARKQALQMAVKQAQTQANDVLQTLNLSVKSVQRIQVNAVNNAPQPVPLSAVAYSRADSAPTPVEGGSQTVAATVTMDFAY